MVAFLTISMKSCSLWLIGVLLLQLRNFGTSECENGCSGHGRCTVYDMCLCDRNWQGNDCGARICGFAPAFVDTPKGDLDSSDSVDFGTNVENSITYPYGTSEQFPLMTDSDLNPVIQSAHDYAECSNAGLCNRTTGICECFEGFSGAACQRLSCPGEYEECSGHGTCHSLQRIANMDYHSSYFLWNKDNTHGCVCDPGFYGGDCSMRRCKHGLDPLYLDEVGAVDVPTYFFAIMTTSDRFDLTDGFAQPKPGYFRIKVYDNHGQGWLTNRIDVGASCEDVIAALEAIPHRVVPKGQTKCYVSLFDDENALAPNASVKIHYNSLYKLFFGGTKVFEAIRAVPAVDEFGYKTSYAAMKNGDTLLAGYIYLLRFFGNLGNFGQPEINTHQYDGMRPSLASNNGTVVARAWTNGNQGFDTDYWTDRCEGVQVKLKSDNGEGFFWGAQFALEPLRQCLGDADNNASNDKVLFKDGKAYHYDDGDAFTPHLVRLVRSQGDTTDGGLLAAVFFDPTSDFVAGLGLRDPGGVQNGAFRLLNPIYSLDFEGALYDVFATKGTLKSTDKRAAATFSFGSNKIYTSNSTLDLMGKATAYDGDITCEALNLAPGESSAHMGCLDKNDLFILANPYTGAYNPPFMNLYTARSIQRFHDATLDSIEDVYSELNVSASEYRGRGNLTSRFKKNMITTDINVNWANEVVSESVFHVYKFTPYYNDTFKYVAECSNRGLCNVFEGTCDCFFGYTSDDCSEQNTVIF